MSSITFVFFPLDACPKVLYDFRYVLHLIKACKYIFTLFWTELLPSFLELTLFEINYIQYDSNILSALVDDFCQVSAARGPSLHWKAREHFISKENYLGPPFIKYYPPLLLVTWFDFYLYRSVLSRISDKWNLIVCTLFYLSPSISVIYIYVVCKSRHSFLLLCSIPLYNWNAMNFCEQGIGWTYAFIFSWKNT